MNKIHVIDLLNKIANKEEVPKQFKWNNIIYTKQENDYIYLNYHDENFIEDLYFDGSNLNDEIEIIDDEEPKKIEKINKREKLNPVEKDILLISLADYFVKCMNQENPLFDCKDILNTIRKVTILFDDEEVI